jgi:hypothetical protein
MPHRDGVVDDVKGHGTPRVVTLCEIAAAATDLERSIAEAAATSEAIGEIVRRAPPKLIGRNRLRRRGGGGTRRQN